MSGPKVVRVVTREELQARANVVLSRLDEALRRWERRVANLGLSDGALSQNMRARRDALARMIDADQFAAFERDATSEIAYLEANYEEQRVAAEQERAQQIARRLARKENARWLSTSLRCKCKGNSRASELAAKLESLVSAPTSDQLDSLCAEATRLLADGDSTGLSDAAKAIAERLAPGGEPQSAASMAKRPTAPDNRIDVLVRQLATLTTILGEEATQGFQARLEALLLAEQGMNRNMQLDTLTTQLSDAVKAAREVDALVSKVSELNASLEALHAGTDEWERLFQEGMRNRSATILTEALSLGTALLSEATALVASRARRLAVLDGLSKLGYIVSEGMTTTTEEFGRLVLRRADSAAYGVEVVVGRSEKMQVRAVALSEERDKASDVPAESIWCSDFGRLQKQMQDVGSTVDIEKSFPVGAVPLKVVTLVEEEVIARKSRLRSGSR